MTTGGRIYDARFCSKCGKQKNVKSGASVRSDDLEQMPEGVPTQFECALEKASDDERALKNGYLLWLIDESVRRHENKMHYSLKCSLEPIMSSDQHQSTVLTESFVYPQRNWRQCPMSVFEKRTSKVCARNSEKR